MAQARKRPTTRKAGDWKAVGGLTLMLRKGAFKLNVGVHPIGNEADWGVIAIVTPSKVSGPEAVLAHHAHKLIGMFPFREALDAAEAFARTWEPGADGRCDCREIPTRRPRARR
jgi:hypothetical protein